MLCSSASQIEDLLEDDDERDLFHRLVFQAIDESEPGLFFVSLVSVFMSFLCDTLNMKNLNPSLNN